MTEENDLLLEDALKRIEMCSEPNWDDENATAISSNLKDIFRNFYLKLKKNNILLPSSIAPTLDGNINVDWRSNIPTEIKILAEIKPNVSNKNVFEIEILYLDYYELDVLKTFNLQDENDTNKCLEFLKSHV